MNISEFSTSPGATLTTTDLVRLASFGFEIAFDTIYAGYLIDRVLLRLAELYPATPKHWSRTEIRYWLNDAINELNLIAGYLTKTVDLTWSNTTNVLSLPNDTVAVQELYYNNEIIKKYTIDGLDSKGVWDNGATGLKPLAWCAMGTTKVLVSPMAPTTGLTIKAVILYQPTEITLDTAQALEVMPQYMPAIEHYMFARARFKEGGAEFVQADADYARFFELANDLRIRSSRKRRVTWKDRFQLESAYVRLKDEGAR